MDTSQRYLKNAQNQRVKPLKYENFLLALIHELVHYRFEDELEHGPEFNQRVNEIFLEGKKRRNEIKVEVGNDHTAKPPRGVVR